MIEALIEALGQWILLRRLNPFRYIFSSKYREATHQRWRQESPWLITVDILAGVFGLALVMILMAIIILVITVS